MALVLAFVLSNLTLVGEVNETPYYISKAGCKGYENLRGDWFEKTFFDWTIGLEFKGHIAPERPDFVIGLIEGKIFALPLNCVQALPIMSPSVSVVPVPTISPTPIAPTPSPLVLAPTPVPYAPNPIAEVNPKTIGKRKIHSIVATTGLVSWKEPLTLRQANGASYDLLATTIASCTGVLAIQRWFRHFGTSFSICGLWGFSEASEFKSSVTYRDRGAQVYGVLSTPSLIWFPSDDSISFAASVPLLLRWGGWYAPAGGYSIDSGSKFLPGAMLQVQYERGYFHIAPQVGVLFKTLDSLLFGLEVGFQFY